MRTPPIDIVDAQVNSRAAEDELLSVVIPCYNEAAVLPLLKDRLITALAGLSYRWEVVFVDDGSRDGTYEQLVRINKAEPRCRVIALSRNFGHQVAISAGLTGASGDYIAIMDADLQDPPELLGSALGLIKEGYDVVYAVRRKRKEHALKRFAYGAFYRLLNHLAEVEIPLDAGDFCVMTRRIVDVLKNMPERNQFVRGLRAWAGFRQIGLEYERESRLAGETKYPFRKLLRLAVDGLFSFSTGPLRFSVYLGIAALLVCVALGIFTLVWRVAGFSFMGKTAAELPGWSAVILSVILFSGVQLVILGIMGIYLGMVYAEVKKRPRWIARETLGFENSRVDLGDFPAHQ